MDLPTPPTDNLYKFQALSGLIVFVFLGWFVFNKIDETINFILQNNYELRLKEKSFRELLEGVHQSEIDFHQTNIANIRAAIDDAKKQKVKIDNSFDQITTNYFSTDVEEKDYAKAKKTYSWLKLFFLIGAGCAGLLRAAQLSILGFRNWHRKVQVYEDIILRQNSKKLLKEKRNSSKGK